MVALINALICISIIRANLINESLNFDYNLLFGSFALFKYINKYIILIYNLIFF